MSTGPLPRVLLSSLLCLCVTGDIPGIPKWAMDLAKCAPGSPAESRVLGLRNRNSENNGNRLRVLQRSNEDSENERRVEVMPSLRQRTPLLSRRQRRKRLGYANDVSDGINKWPFIGRFEFAELQNWFPKKHMISNVGTLISPSLVLTARHVIDNIEPDYQKKVTKIYFGSSSRWTVSLSDTTRTITEIFFYPDPLVDLAILRLNSPVNCLLNKVAAPVPLATGSLDRVYECKSASWGKDENDQCPTSMKSGSFRLFKQKHGYEICAKGVNKTLTNVGDSGMPLMCKEPKTGDWLQYGAFSYDFWTGDYKVSCFVAVPYCYDWIQKKIAQFEDEQEIERFNSRCPAPKSFD